MILDAESVTFNGRTYGQYSLVMDGGISQRQTSLTYNVSSYRETISLWFRAESSEGTFLLIGNTSFEHQLIKVYKLMIKVFMAQSFSIVDKIRRDCVLT